MKRWHRLLAPACALFLLNAATQIVIRANRSAGLYPPEAEIGIPLMTTLYLSLVMTPWLLLLALLARSALRPASVIAGLVALYLPAVFVAAAGIYYWATPFHYAIAATYALLLLVLAGLAWDDVRVLRARMVTETPALPPRPARPLHQGAWYLIGTLLFLYALPYIHNLGCIEAPFGTGFDLALLYLGLPALGVAVFGGRGIRARLGLSSARAGALIAGAALFFWTVVLGQGYVLLANALLSPQRPLVYEGIVVGKLRSGFQDRNRILRVELASAAREVISMEVSEYDFSRLHVGDRVAQPMMLGALQIPYIARCRWLPSARRGGT